MSKKANRRSTAAIGYVRVSTDEQASSGLGLESQRRVIEAEASSHGWDLAEVVGDEGLSAKSIRQPSRAVSLPRTSRSRTGFGPGGPQAGPTGAQRWGLCRTCQVGREAGVGNLYIGSRNRHDHAHRRPYGEHQCLCGRVGTPNHLSANQRRLSRQAGAGCKTGEAKATCAGNRRADQNRTARWKNLASHCEWFERGADSYANGEVLVPRSRPQDHPSRASRGVTIGYCKSVFSMRLRRNVPAPTRDRWRRTFVRVRTLAVTHGVSLNGEVGTNVDERGMELRTVAVTHASRMEGIANA